MLTLLMNTHLLNFEAKREAKKAVARAKEKAYKDLYRKLDSKEGANDIFRIAKARERRRGDIDNIEFIKNEAGQTLVKEDNIRKRWEGYFSSLFDGGRTERHEDRQDSNIEQSQNNRHYESIHQEEVRSALRKMGRNKVVGPYRIPIEAWRCLDDDGVRWLTCLFNKTFRSSKMPMEWILSETIPIYKNKGDAQICDLEKAYDCVPQNLIRKTLNSRSIPNRYISVIRDMYEGAKSCVRTPVGNIEVFPIEVGLHQGSALSPFLFALILDELSRGIQVCIPWCLILADDIVLVSESKEELNRRLEQWRVALESNGLQISRQKTEYLRCDFSTDDDEQDDGVNICIRDQILHPQISFRYLGSVLHKSGKVDEDVSHRIKVGWVKWRAATGVLCDKNIPLKLKENSLRWQLDMPCYTDQSVGQ
ncbi:uncharacterized protein [Rutidosis leptorrhynchoides]|uniref:uncharacterized protein n=1 Tax=Rutidosis leptorrhynchoides TaxID=125765 RepID=UPI003A99BF8C